MSPALAAVEAIYFQMQQRLSDMLSVCTNEERAAVMTAYVQARQNYFVCIGKAFHDDDPVLETLVAQAETSAETIQHIDDQLGDVARMIRTLSTAVQYGSQIAAKVITL